MNDKNYTNNPDHVFILVIQLLFGKWHGHTLNLVPSWLLVPMMVVFLFSRNKTVLGRKFTKVINTLLQVRKFFFFDLHQKAFIAKKAN